MREKSFRRICMRAISISDDTDDDGDGCEGLKSGRILLFCIHYVFHFRSLWDGVGHSENAANERTYFFHELSHRHFSCVRAYERGRRGTSGTHLISTNSKSRLRLWRVDTGNTFENDQNVSIFIIQVRLNIISRMRYAICHHEAKQRNLAKHRWVCKFMQMRKYQPYRCVSFASLSGAISMKMWDFKKSHFAPSMTLDNGQQCIMRM